MEETLRLTYYANRPPRTPILQYDRVIIKDNQKIKVMSQLIDRNHMERRIKNIKNISKG